MRLIVTTCSTMRLVHYWRISSMRQVEWRRACERFRQSMARAQETFEEWKRQNGRAFSEDTGISDCSVEDAWYSIEELIIWTRVLLDRLKRTSVKQGFPDQGLIPGMAEGSRRDAVIQARSTLLSSAAGEARYLAGLDLHMQPYRAGSKGGRIRSGRVILEFPEPSQWVYRPPTSAHFRYWPRRYFIRRRDYGGSESLHGGADHRIRTARSRTFQEVRSITRPKYRCDPYVTPSAGMRQLGKCIVICITQCGTRTAGTVNFSPPTILGVASRLPLGT